MNLFFIKKNFCDGWDNMMSLIVPNVVIELTGAGLSFIVYLAGKASLFLALPVFVICMAVFTVFVFAFGDNAARIANFDAGPIANYFKQIPSCIGDGLLFGALTGVLIVLGSVGIPYYLGILTVHNQHFYPAFLVEQPVVGQIIAMLIFWVLLICFLAMQWFLPLRSLMHGSFRKTLKKCFIIFFDNTGFSIFMALYDLLLLIFSVFLFVLFMPSSSGITLARVNALRLRLYKYDWLEAHPELTTKAQQQEVPWNDLIAEDKETLGPRTLRSFIFPWKN